MMARPQSGANLRVYYIFRPVPPGTSSYFYLYLYTHIYIFFINQVISVKKNARIKPTMSFRFISQFSLFFFSVPYSVLVICVIAFDKRKILQAKSNDIGLARFTAFWRTTSHAAGRQAYTRLYVLSNKVANLHARQLRAGCSSNATGDSMKIKEE